MLEEGKAVSMELIPASPAVPQRDRHGHFLPGNNLSVGNTSTAGRKLMSQLSKRLEEVGPSGNPLLIMHDIATDLSQPVKTRLLAAHKLTQFLLPTLGHLSLDQPNREALETEAVRVTETLRSFFKKED